VKVGDLVNWTAVPPMDLHWRPVAQRLCIVVEKSGFGVKVRSVLTGQLFATIETSIEVISESRQPSKIQLS